MESMRAVLSHAVDYAGLFPPASFNLEQSCKNYLTYSSGKDAWALGSLILPLSALSRFERLAGSEAIPVSVVLGPEPEQELREMRPSSRTYQLFECRIADADCIRPIMAEAQLDSRVFFEVDAYAASPALLSAIRDAGAYAKIRMGGIVDLAVPSPGVVAQFLFFCSQLHVPFKATAGLHHPIRDRYSLTYEVNPPMGIMHGYVNLMFATAMVHFGASESDACAVLGTTDRTEFICTEDGLRWRDCTLTTGQLAEVRKQVFMGFGSCSFTEPIEESKMLGWL